MARRTGEDPVRMGRGGWVREGVVSGLGLALVLVLLASWGMTAVPSATVAAAPLPQRTRQPTSNTATPRITLPTRTPTARPSATRSAPTTMPTIGAAVTDSPVETAEPVATGGSAEPVGTIDPGGEPGPEETDAPGESASTTGPGSRDAGAGPDPPGPLPIDPPSLPDGATGGAGAAALAGAGPGGGARTGEMGDEPRTGPGDGEQAADPAASGLRDDEVGPSGIVRVPVADPRLRALWSERGSPRQGQGLVERFTAHRPGPWSFAPFYLAVMVSLGLVVFKLWGALRALEVENGEVDGGARSESDR